MVSETELLDMFSTLSNWGKWGADDELGTLNYIQGRQRADAVALIREGSSVGCQRRISASPEPVDPRGAQRLMVTTGESGPKEGEGFASEWVRLHFHGTSITHLDSLGHAFWNGRLFGGRDASSVGIKAGAGFGSIAALEGAGIICRGLLADIPRSQGREFLDPGELVGPEDLLRCCESESIEMRSGDALFVRTGRDKAMERLSESPERFSGLDPACLPLIHDREISILGSDGISDATLPGEPELRFPIHQIGITAMGLWLIDNLALEHLAAECERRDSWAFCLMLAPLDIAGATASAVNPLAVF
jgi:kynurenine formamidase